MTALGGLGLHITEVSRSHSNTPHSVGLLWASNQPITETSTWQHSQQTGIHAPGRIQTHNPSTQVTTDSQPRPHGATGISNEI